MRISIIEDNLPFSDAPNTACLTCVHVVDEKFPILFVSHDADDGAWQFLCNVHEHDDDDIQVVSLRSVAALDPSLQTIAGLPLGVTATRESLTETWTQYEES